MHNINQQSYSSNLHHHLFITLLITAQVEDDIVLFEAHTVTSLLTILLSSGSLQASPPLTHAERMSRSYVQELPELWQCLG